MHQLLELVEQTMERIAMPITTFDAKAPALTSCDACGMDIATWTATRHSAEGQPLTALLCDTCAKRQMLEPEPSLERDRR